jgi:FkbM family methyltransferase
MQEVREGDTIVDVSAYIGVLTIAMAKKIGNTGKVIAFEPNPQSLALLKKT